MKGYLGKSILLVICILMVGMNLAVFADDTYLTDEELAYIDENPVIVTGIDPEFAPFEFIDSDGIYKGIASDYLKLIEIKTGLTFRIVEDVTWADAYDMALAGDIDLLPCIGITDQRQELFSFSDSYLTYQRVLLSRDDSITHSFDDLEDYTVGVQRNSSHYSFLIGETDTIPVTYESLDELLIALSYNDIDVAVGNYATSRYRIKQLGLSSIKIDDVYDKGTTYLAMAVTNDNQVLVDIINDTLAHLTEEEKVLIQNKWLGIELAPDYTSIIKNIILGIVIAFVVIGFILNWNYTLKREIARRKKVGAQLVVTKKEAEHANEAKSTFLAHMSHEIRTPLNAISGLAYLLENTTTSGIQKKYIKNLKDASYNLLNIINDILDFSKIEAGEVSIEEVPFSLDELLNKTRALFMHRATEKDIAFHVKKAVDIEDKVIGDPTRIEQILINLINNAIKFTHQGEVYVEVSVVSMSDELCMLQFTVSDTGIGITDNQMKHLFVPFHQLDSSITRKYGGTGLGLSISKNLVTMLNGTIDVTSIKDVGTTFKFIIPLKLQIVTENTYFHRASGLENIKALVIDVDQYTRKIVGDYLTSFHIDRLLVDNLEVACKLLTDEAINLIIVENNMNGQEGLEIVEYAKTIGKEVEVILLAKQMVESQYEFAESLGVKHTIMKPIISSILFDSIIQCFSAEIVVDYTNDDDTRLIVSNGEHYKVLLVEDNEVNQIIEREILEQWGYDVILANNGAEAVDSMRRKADIAIVLMDIHMPVMDGYEAARKIREFNKDVPIIAMTAASFANDKQKCVEVGMTGYVTKPVDPSKLFEEIKLQVHGDVTYTSHVDTKKTIEQRVEDCDVNNYLDIKQGLKQIGNNKKLYYEVLEKYYRDILDDREKISLLIKNKAYDEAHKLVHKINGCSGNIGGLKLFQSSKMLIDAMSLGIEVDIGPYLWEFESDFEHTLEVIKCILNEITEDQEEKEMNKELEQHTKEVEEMINQLEELLLKADLDAFIVYEQIKSKISMNDIIWSEVDMYMKKYDFDNAYRALKKYK